MRKVFILSMMFLGVALAGHAQVFEFRYAGVPLLDKTVVTISSVPDSFFHEILNCQTNPAPVPRDGLVVAVLDGSVKTGTAKLEVLSNTLQFQTLQWCMGGACEIMNDKASLVKSFTTGEDGLAVVEFDASNVEGNGRLQAILKVEIDGESQALTIQFQTDTETSVTSLHTETVGGGFYDLRGNSIKSLDGRQGVFIQNGRKVLIKVK